MRQQHEVDVAGPVTKRCQRFEHPRHGVRGARVDERRAPALLDHMNRRQAWPHVACIDRRDVVGSASHCLVCHHIRMRRSYPALLLVVLATLPAQAAREERGNLILDGVPDVSAALTERVAPWLQARSAEFRGWLPDGSMLVTTRFAETDQLHRVAAPLGAREQLTYGAEVLAANASPAPGAAPVTPKIL